MSENYDRTPDMTTQDVAVQIDYFNFRPAMERFVFPDGITWIEYEGMNEGTKSQYQRAVSRPLTVERGGSTTLIVDPTLERHELIKACVKDWNLTRMGKPVACNEVNKRDLLRLGDPTVLDKLERAIRDANPWLTSELSVEDIDEQMDELKKMREEAVKREAGEGSSSNK